MSVLLFVCLPSFCLSVCLTYCWYIFPRRQFLLLFICLSLRTTVYFDYTDSTFLNLKSQTKLTSEGKKTVCISSKHLSIFSLVFPPNCQTVVLSVCSFLLYVYKLRKTFTIKWKISSFKKATFEKLKSKYSNEKWKKCSLQQSVFQQNKSNLKKENLIFLRTKFDKLSRTEWIK